MEKLVKSFSKGDILVLPFPFSNLADSKKRPALVVANPIGDDILLAQITSRYNSNEFTVDLFSDDFEDGSLPSQSFVKINRLFSADSTIINYKIARLKGRKINDLQEKLLYYITR